MIIDGHVHIDHNLSSSDIYSAASIIKTMDELEIEKAVIFPKFSLRPDNKGLSELVRRYPNRFIGFAWINPHLGEEAVYELEELVIKYNFKGLKLHPLLHAFFPQHHILNLLMKKAEELNILVTIHSGHGPFSLPWQIAEIAERFPNLNIIMDHMGMQLGYVDEAINLAEKFSNIYLGTTAMPFHLKIKEAVERIGSQRIIFGSDAPVIHPLPELERVRVSGISSYDQELVLGGNLKRLLCL